MRRSNHPRAGGPALNAAARLGLTALLCSLASGTHSSAQGSPQNSSQTLRCPVTATAPLEQREACAQQSRQRTAEIMQRMVQGQPPTTVNQSSTEAQRQAALKASGYSAPRPAAAPAVSAAQRSAAQQNPAASAAAAEAARKAMGSPGELKAASAAQVQSLLAAGRKSITLLSSAPGPATLSALASARKAGASVRVITQQSAVAAVRAAVPGATVLAIPAGGARQGLAVIDGKVTILGSFKDGASYGVSASVLMSQTVEENFGDLIKTLTKR